jgi:hypothetical protein
MIRRAGGAACAVGLALLGAGCAKKAPPSGGPPDIEPPRLVASTPDSGAAGVARDVRPSLTFSEGMEPRSTGDAVAFAPRVEIEQRRWKGSTLTLTLADTLERDRTYTLFVGTGARDRHGNSLSGGASLTFSTADTFPPGTIEGQVEARGLSPAGIYLWGYQTPGEPDSTARDFDALAFTDGEGRFRLIGLRVPAAWRLWAFADLNQNRSFEPLTDVLVPIDTVLALTRETPEAAGLALLVVNPRAEAKVAGTVVDTLGDSLGVVRLLAVSAADTTVRLLGEVMDENRFELSLAAGTWEIRAFRDIDRNRRYDAVREPASEALRLELAPAVVVADRTLVLEPPQGAAPRPPGEP